MPFDTPTLPALVTRAAADLQREGIDGALRRSDADVLARVLAGGAFGLYGLLAWLAGQVLPDTCDEDQLARWAALKGIARTPATVASGHITATGAAGVRVPSGTQWQTGAGALLVVTADTVLAGGAAAVPVASAAAGQGGNVAAGTALAAVSPVVGMVDQAVVGSAGITGGTDAEPLERWRDRVVQSFRLLPHGGDAADYEAWAREVPGITRAWCRPLRTGPGTVAVFVVRDDDTPITPDPAALQAVQDHINTVRPVTADVTMLAPALLPVAYQLRITPDTAEVRAQVEQALRALHQAEGDLGAAFYRSHMRQAISNAPGEVDHTLTEPAADVAPAENELPTFGGITWL